MSDPATDFDGPWKEALEGFFRAFLELLFPVPAAAIDWTREPVFLDTELAEVAPESAAGRGTTVTLWFPVHEAGAAQGAADWGNR